MKVVVINLRRRPDRRAAFESWNRHQPCHFEFSEAVDGRCLDRKRLIEAGVIDGDDCLYNPASIGNALSHRALWEQCAAGREPFFIIEDDCCLRGDFWRHARQMAIRDLAERDMILFGFNTDADISICGKDGTVSVIRFNESIKRKPGYFNEYASLQHERPNLYRCGLFWGILAYAVNPSGARKLIKECFPLSSRQSFDRIGTHRQSRPVGLDGSINVASQAGRLDIAVCYPPLALGPNSRVDSDIQVPA